MEIFSLIPMLTIGLLLVMLFRSASNFFKLRRNIRWIQEGRKSLLLKTEQKTSVVVCIPMLREQRIVKETMDFFSEMNAANDKTAIIVVTTEKERHEKEMSRHRIKDLCEAIFDKQTLDEVNEQFLGLLDSARLKEVYKLVLESKNLSSAVKVVNAFYDEVPTTNQLATEMVKELSTKPGSPAFRVINYLETEGAMAHQVNFCAQWVNKNLPSFKKSMFAVYNADSRPDPKTFIAVDQVIDVYKQNYGKDLNLVQQSALFLSNVHTFPKTFISTLLRICAITQSKWTLTHELDRLRQQSTYTAKGKHGWLDILLRSKLSHCVGHGLFVRLPFLLDHPLPTNLMNEDLPFGYYRSCEREPIAPLPLLENAESPETIRGVVNQKRVWFWPYLEYLKCRKRSLEEREYKSRMEVEWLTTQGLMVGFIWFFQSIAFTLPLIIGIVYLDLIIVSLWLAIMLIYWIAPITHMQKEILSKNQTWNSPRLMTGDYLCIVPFLAFYSLGPWLATKDKVKRRLFDTTIRKMKTER
jgi:hemolysin-activating ACP:hemolysin acyltransferase